MPKGAFLVGYAGDVAVVVEARNADLAQLILCQVMTRVTRWMTEHGLSLALAKTEVVLLTRKGIPTILPMYVGSEIVTTRPTAKYLGVTLDSKLCFWPHIREVTAKAEARIAALSRLMRNIGGPWTSERRLLMATTNSILLYGAEIWADAMEVNKYRKRMVTVQRRGALRVACAYRTVSEEAVAVIAGTIPIDLLARERKQIYDRCADIGRADAVSEARRQTLQIWHERWRTATKGRWTYLLIHDITK